MGATTEIAQTGTESQEPIDIPNSSHILKLFYELMAHFQFNFDLFSKKIYKILGLTHVRSDKIFPLELKTRKFLESSCLGLKILMIQKISWSPLNQNLENFKYFFCYLKTLFCPFYLLLRKKKATRHSFM